MNILTKKKPIQVLCFICVYFLYSTTFAQKSDSLIQSGQLIFTYNHTTFLLGVLTGNSIINSEFGEIDLKNRIGFRFSFAFLKTHNFNSKFGLEYGVAVGALPLSFYFKLTPNRTGFTSPDIEKITEFLEFISFPLQLVYRKDIKPTIFLSLHSGISLRYIFLGELGYQVGYRYSNGSREVIFDLNSTFENKLLLNLKIEVGISKLLENYHFMNLKLAYNYSPYNIMNGEYVFFPERVGDALYTKGQIRTNGSYLGLSVGYTFTKVRKMMKRLKKEKRGE